MEATTSNLETIRWEQVKRLLKKFFKSTAAKNMEQPPTTYQVMGLRNQSILESDIPFKRPKNVPQKFHDSKKYVCYCA